MSARRLRSGAIRTTGVVALAWAAACTGVSHLAPPPAPDGAFVAGYHPYWAGDSWGSYPFDVLDRLYFFETEARADGSLELHGWPIEWVGLVEAAEASGVSVVPTVSMHDADGFEALFVDPARTDRLAVSIVDLIRTSPAVDGVHLDFEVFRPVVPRARDGFTAFVVRLAGLLRSLDPTLSVSVFALAFDRDDVFNERALAAVADYLVIQGYDFHGLGSARAGPTAPTAGWDGVNWEEAVRRFDDLGIPRQKIVMSVPLFGYEWPVQSGDMGAATRGAGVTVPFTAPPDVLPELPRALEQGARYGVEREASSGSVWYRFEDDAGWRQGWFDDEQSLTAKYALARSLGLGGVALFPLAYGNERVWEGLRRAFPTR